MSVTFFVTASRYRYEDEGSYLNVTASNAAELLAWLGFPEAATRDLGVERIVLDARDLAARCRRRLWPEARNLDPARPGSVAGRLVVCGRGPGYLRRRTEELLALAERAGGGTISLL